MQLASKIIAPSLRALLEHFIDYAGVFPPAALTLDVAAENFSSYKESDYAWMLRWFVVNAADLDRVPANLDGSLSVLAEADEPRATTIESKGIVKAAKPVYCEVALSNLQQLDAVQAAGCFGKMRTGGVTPEAIPSPEDVAHFILFCAGRRLPFKATAGLHHPIRAEYALTYKPDAPRAVMHGFLNVLMASAFAWMGEHDIEPILRETDPQAFVFDECARWRDRALTAAQIKDARKNFIHSVGSCSFDEPVHELQALGLL